MATVVRRARPPTETQYVSGERDSTRRRTDALHSRGEIARGKRRPEIKRPVSPDLGLSQADLDSLFLSFFESELLVSDFDSDDDEEEDDDDSLSFFGPLEPPEDFRLSVL